MSDRGGPAAPNERGTQPKPLRGALADWVPEGTPDALDQVPGGRGDAWRCQAPGDGSAEGEF